MQITRNINKIIKECQRLGSNRKSMASLSWKTPGINTQKDKRTTLTRCKPLQAPPHTTRPLNPGSSPVPLRKPREFPAHHHKLKKVRTPHRNQEM